MALKKSLCDLALLCCHNFFSLRVHVIAYCCSAGNILDCSMYAKILHRAYMMQRRESDESEAGRMGEVCVCVQAGGATWTLI